MKGQQLFHSFLPGVTAAVLTTQPAWAGTVKVNGVQLTSSPSVLTSIYGRTLVADVTNTLPYTAERQFPSLLVSSHRNLLDAKPLTKPLSHHSTPLIGTGNTSSIKSQILRVNQASFYSLSPSFYATQKPDINRSVDSNQKQNKSATSGQQLKNIVVTTTNSKLFSVQKNKLPLLTQNSFLSKKTNCLCHLHSNPQIRSKILIRNCRQFH